MNQEAPKLSTDCQLQELINAGSELTARNRLRGFALRMLTALERRIYRARGALGQKHLALPQASPNFEISRIEEGGMVPAGKPGGIFKPGEKVMVLSREEIEETLDKDRRCKSLEFMDRMAAYCGRPMVVKKHVQCIFDERKWRMVRIKDTYILEGAICEGQGMYEKEGCDRCCYFFWKDQWLRRVG
jgi:ribosomal protein L34